MRTMKQGFDVDGHPQALLLESLSNRILRNLKISDWREVLANASQAPVQVRSVQGSVVCVQCPAWGSYPTLKADIALLARAKGGHVDPCPGTDALVLLRDANDALSLAMELRELAAGVRFHVGIATGQFELATIQCSGQTLHIVVGALADQAALACELAPAGTFRMSPSTFERLDDQASSLASCMLQTEFEGEDVCAISVTPPPLKGGEQLSTFAGLGLM
jgi:hypothetical protein